MKLQYRTDYQIQVMPDMKDRNAAAGLGGDEDGMNSARRFSV